MMPTPYCYQGDVDERACYCDPPPHSYVNAINIRRYTGRTETELSFYHLPGILLIL